MKRLFAFTLLSLIGISLASPLFAQSNEIPVYKDGDFTDSFGGIKGNWYSVKVIVPAGTTQLLLTIEGGNGDPDLYVWHESQKDENGSFKTEDAIGSSTMGGAEERVDLRDPEAGTYWVYIYAFSDFSETTFRVVYHENQMDSAYNGVVDFETIGADFVSPWELVDAAIASSPASNGSVVMRSKNISDGESTQKGFNSTFKVDNGRFSFDWKVSSESGYDVFEFYIDDQLIFTESGESGWKTYESEVLLSGYHTYKFLYKKDAIDTMGDDCVYIDNIRLSNQSHVDSGGFEEVELVGSTQTLVDPSSSAVVELKGARVDIPVGAFSSEVNFGIVASVPVANGRELDDGSKIGNRVISPYAYTFTLDRKVELKKSISVRIPLDTENILVGTDKSRFDVSVDVGGFLIPQGKPSIVDYEGGFIEFSIDPDSSTTAMSSELRTHGVGTTLVAAYLVFQKLNLAKTLTTGFFSVVATLDYRQITHYTYQPYGHFNVCYNTNYVSSDQIIDIRNTLETAHQLFEVDLGFELPNFINLDGKYMIVFDRLSEHIACKLAGWENINGFTLPGNITFEGASYVNESTLEQMRFTAVYEYFHALQYGALGGMTIIQYDGMMNPDSAWLWEGSASALSARIVSGNRGASRDWNLKEGITQGYSLYDNDNQSAPQAAQDFFYFLEKELGGPDFYYPVFNTLHNAIGVSKNRELNALQEVVSVRRGNDAGIPQLWGDFIENYTMLEPELYWDAEHPLSATETINVSSETFASSYNLPPMSYVVVDISLPADRSSGPTAIKGMRDVTMKVSQTQPSTESDCGYLLVDSLRGQGFQNLRERHDFYASMKSVEKTYTDYRSGSERKHMFVVLYNGDLENDVTLQIDCSLAGNSIPEPNDPEEPEPASGPFVIHGISSREEPLPANPLVGNTNLTNPSAQQIGEFIIQISDDPKRPTFSWPNKPDALLIVGVDVTRIDLSNPLASQHLYFIQGMDADGFVSINSPLLYGDYSKPNTMRSLAYDAPDLKPGELYALTVSGVYESSPGQNIAVSMVVSFEISPD